MNILLQGSFFTKKIKCKVFGHKLVTTKDITNHIKEYQCKCCGLELTNNYKGVKSILTPELKDVNVTVMDFYHRRHQRQTA
ncbi:hypothetical protein FIA58_003640 [Flavobacterium jejuense]|uniref:Transposase IS66 zinc-finger binding domain-containing protein n=1 Tax=Flavobacterium jejuense TaxID=1544455 RepID=A0ABX0INX5_9FLAO|nr:hypothetical protein [Flavobacterium jejuense]NHN24760.1 hypothetical protein [Flavobacterium jejuense]